ncbi:MAG: ribonuclease HII [Verrucomicrobia bacterium]|nr:MAG: ribonuclease HII [Verrucomicrobiota bacterium]
MAARCSLDHEVSLRAAGFSNIAGVDEAGRGPLAGPLVVAAVILPDGFSHPRLNDSKKLSSKVREQIFQEISEDPTILWAVAELGAEEVDGLNVLRATHEGMRRAVLKLPANVGHVLIDGLPVHPFPFPQTALVGGDGLSLSIAAASVCAKVLRDRIMMKIDAEFPQYGFAKHKGYGTALHLARLREYGPTPYHRRSFAPVQQLSLGL